MLYNKSPSMRLVQVPGVRNIIIFGLFGLFSLINVILIYNYTNVSDDSKKQISVDSGESKGSLNLKSTKDATKSSKTKDYSNKEISADVVSKNSLKASSGPKNNARDHQISTSEDQDQDSNDSDFADVEDSVVTKMIKERDSYFSYLKSNLLDYFDKNKPEYSKIKKSTSEMIIIEDKYPQGSNHYLCLPKKAIDSWWHLKKGDIPLLLNMKKEAEIFANEQVPDAEFIFGFHALPSMRRLHLHIVNKDFEGMSGHKWNTFNTEFLVTIDQVIKELEDIKGKGIIIFSKEKVLKYDALHSGPFKCPSCNEEFNQFKDVKTHYNKHKKNEKQ